MALSDARVYNFLATVAAIHNRHINADTPVLEGHLPFGGERIEGLIPPVVAAPAFVIRRHTSLRITLADYIESGILQPDQAEHLREAVTGRKNILVAGGTGSGKTTLLNALLAELADAGNDDRLVIIEDTRELRVFAANHTRLETAINVGMTQLLAATMRLRPDRIIVGEVRDGAALALLKAWGTGHPGGLATVHAETAQGALNRLELLIGEATHVNDQIRQMIGQGVDLIVVIERARGAMGRRLREMAHVHDYTQNRYQIESLVTTHGDAK